MNQYFKRQRLSKEDEEVEAQFKKYEEERKNAPQEKVISEENKLPKKSQKFKRVRTANTMFLARQGIHFSARHFMKEMTEFMPNVQQVPKFTGEELISLNQLAAQEKCETIMLLESKSEETHFLYISVKDEGPTVCFRLTNTYGVDELNPLGNCTKNSSPLLIFDKAFDATPEYEICKNLLTRALSVPYRTRGMKSTIDTALSFFILEGHVWFRRYQVSWDEDKIRLFEAGPRFCLQPIYISSGSFCGLKIWQNPDVVQQAEMMKKMIQKKKKTRVIESMGKLEN